MDAHCATCRHYDEATSTCRINPPVVPAVMSASMRGGAVWPQVEPVDWCSQHDTVE